MAVKVLPDALSADPDRVARFEREARTLATLNHTHIAQIYGVEELPPEPGRDGGRAPVMGTCRGPDTGGSHRERLATNWVAQMEQRAR